MIEISDRAFGGISTDAKLRWTTEKFREALVEISEMASGDGGETAGRSMSISSSSSSSSSHGNDDIIPTSPAAFCETNTQHDAVRQGEVESGEKARKR